MKDKKKLLYLLIVPFIVFRYNLLFAWIPARYGISINQTFLYEMVTHLYMLAWLYLPAYLLILLHKKLGYILSWVLLYCLFSIQMVCTGYGNEFYVNVDLWINLFVSAKFFIQYFNLYDATKRQEMLMRLTKIFLVVSFFVLVAAIFLFNIQPLLLALIMLEMVLLIPWVILALWDKTIAVIYRKNQEKIELARMEELAKYNAEKLAMMKNIQNDIVATDHRLFYILYQLDLCLQNKEYEKAHEVLQKYKDLVTKYKIVVNTGNAIFDTLYSLKMNDFIMREKKIENCIFISQNAFYNGFEFVNFICELLNYFMKCNSLYISMDEINENVVFKIIYRDGEIPIAKIEGYLKMYLKGNDTYNLSEYETKGIRIMIDMNGW